MILPIVVIFLVLVCAYLEYNKKVNMNNKVVICVICVLTLVLAFSFMEKYKADHKHLENFENMEDFDVPVVNMTSPSYDEVKEDFADDNFYEEVKEKCDEDETGNVLKVGDKEYKTYYGKKIQNIELSNKISLEDIKLLKEYHQQLKSGKKSCWQFQTDLTKCENDKTKDANELYLDYGIQNEVDKEEKLEKIKLENETKCNKYIKECIFGEDNDKRKKIKPIEGKSLSEIQQYINNQENVILNKNKTDLKNTQCEACDKCDLVHSDCYDCNENTFASQQLNSTTSNTPNPPQSSPIQVPPNNETQPFNQNNQNKSLNKNGNNNTNNNTNTNSNSKLLSEAQTAQNAQKENQNESLLHNFYDKLNYRKPGYSYIDPKHWSVPQKRAPICVTSNTFNPASLYDRGTPTNVLELTPGGDQAATEDFVSQTNVGSILPKFEYKEVY